VNRIKLLLVAIIAILLAYMGSTVFGENSTSPNVLLKEVSYSRPRMLPVGNNTYIIKIKGDSHTTLEFVPGKPVLPVTIIKIPIDKGKKIDRVEVAYSDKKIEVRKQFRIMRAPAPKPLCNCTVNYSYEVSPPGLYPK